MLAKQHDPGRQSPLAAATDSKSCARCPFGELWTRVRYDAYCRRERARHARGRLSTPGRLRGALMPALSRSSRLGRGSAGVAARTGPLASSQGPRSWTRHACTLHGTLPARDTSAHEKRQNAPCVGSSRFSVEPHLLRCQGRLACRPGDAGGLAAALSPRRPGPWWRRRLRRREARLGTGTPPVPHRSCEGLGPRS